MVEFGWQPPNMNAVRPWLRGGYDYGSGDNDPNDNTHGTFFQVLPTPRIHAKFPFFNMMNLRNSFGSLLLRPGRALTIQAEVHSLILDSSRDLWYTGGGAFQPWTFGYQGRTVNGHKGLATLYDVGADYNVNASLTLGGYIGHASGGAVIQSIYPKGNDGNFGYLEFTYRLGHRAFAHLFPTVLPLCDAVTHGFQIPLCTCGHAVAGCYFRIELRHQARLRVRVWLGFDHTVL